MLMTANAEIDIQLTCNQWPEDIRGPVQDAAIEVLSEVWDGSEQPLEVSIVLADDPFVQELNKNYRDKDKPTNVLSFPGEGFMLGDVILAYETTSGEAKAQKMAFEDHVLHLVVHGVLHLLGLDHENDEEAAIMEAMEIRILERLGVKNPYETGNLVS